jgi:hypothetical protein
MTHHRVGDELKLFLSAFSLIEGSIELSEGAHGVLSESKKLLDLPAYSPIRDSAKKLGEGGVIGGVRQDPQSLLRPEGSIEPYG